MAKKKRPKHPERGPLPISHRNSELQTYSFNAIRLMLPPEKFIVRKEEEPDTGVDASFELKDRAGGHTFSTGEKANAQVKSCERLDNTGSCTLLSDGSTISFSVDTYNLNQLLNHHSPVYILYVHSRKLLYYAWARDEANRIEAEGTDWREQDSVAIHFRHRLCRSSLKEFRSRIEKESKLSRNFNEIVTKNVAKSRITVHVNLEEQTVTDPDELREWVLKYGTYLVQRGHAVKLLEEVDKLSPDDKKSSKVLLVRAFAEYARSRYQQASGLLSEVLQKEEELDEADKQFLELIESACSYHNGHLTMEEYIAKQRSLAERGEGEFALARKLDYLRNSYTNELDTDRQEQFLEELRAVAREAEMIDDTSEEFRIMSRTALVLVEGCSYARVLIESVGQMAIALKLGRKPNKTKIMSQLHSRLVDWATKANQLMKDALDTKVARLGADAIESVCQVMFLVYTSIKLREQENMEDPLLGIGNDLIRNQLMPNTRQAIALYERCDDLYGVLKTKLLLANLADLVLNQA